MCLVDYPLQRLSILDGQLRLSPTHFSTFCADCRNLWHNWPWNSHKDGCSKHWCSSETSFNNHVFLRADIIGFAENRFFSYNPPARLSSSDIIPTLSRYGTKLCYTVEVQHVSKRVLLLFCPIPVFCSSTGPSCKQGPCYIALTETQSKCLIYLGGGE